MKNFVAVFCLLSCLVSLSGRVSSQDVKATRITEAVLSQLDSQNPESEINWNSIVDFILESLRQEVVSTGKEQLPIPDINEDFTTKVMFFKVSGNFGATEGYFRNLATLRRTGDVVISNADHTYTLSCALGFGEVNVGFGHYRIRAKRVGSVSGSISGSVGRNSISLTVEVDMQDDHNCKATLKEVRVLELDDMRLRLTGFGILNGLAGKLATNAVRKRRDDLMRKIEIALTKNVEKAIQRVKCNL